MPKIIMPDAPKGQHIINDRYVFQDGVLECSVQDAPLLANILCNYHGCELKYDDVKAEAKAPVDDGSLAAEATKTAKAAK
jgi:hypothetical protein